MPDYCCVIGCRNQRESGVPSSRSFHRIPFGTDEKSFMLRKLWVAAIRRENWTEKMIDNARICSAHFVSGKRSLDASDVDYVPSVFPCFKNPEGPTIKPIDGNVKSVNKCTVKSNTSKKSTGTATLDVRSTIREDVLRALAPDVADWNVKDVAYYFKNHGYLQESKLLEEQEIDGRAMLLMSRNDCLTGLRIKLGPALKIYHMHIHKLQKRTDFLG